MRAALAARQRDEYERDVRQAWTTVAIWVMSHKPKGKLQVPKFEDLLPKPRTPQDVEEEARAMAQALGIPMRRWKKVKVRGLP